MQYADKFTILLYLCTVWTKIFILILQVQFWQYFQPQTHSDVHSRLAFLHLFFLMQPFRYLQKPQADIGCLGEHCSERFVHVLIQPQLVMAILVQEPGPDPRHFNSGILLIGCPASGLHLLARSAGHCSSLQTVGGVPYQYWLQYLFSHKAGWWTSQWCE